MFEIVLGNKNIKQEFNFFLSFIFGESQTARSGDSWPTLGPMLPTNGMLPLMMRASNGGLLLPL